MLESGGGGGYKIETSFQLTCQQLFGCLRSRMYWVRGEGSNSYLSNGRLSITNGSQALQENWTIG